MAEASKSLESIQYSFREVAKKVLPVVVEVDVTTVVKQPSREPQSPFDWFFNQPPGNNNGPREFRRGGLGSGIIVKRAGETYYVVTNNHVIDTATEISVKLSDQRTYKSKVVGKDERKDLAVVSFTTKEALPLADLGDSNALEVGDLVLAVGNPLGFENTITMGIVSALGRRGPQGQSVSPSTDYIQTDASINQGNSGGALVNIRGQVVGINTWIAAPGGGNVGLGFAIPINNAKKAIDDFISKGKVEYGWLGVLPDDVQAAGETDTYPGVAKDLKIENVKGALILNVFRNSPADKGGMLPGDYITRVNGQEIRNRDDLILIVGNLLAGRSYDFDIVRYGERQKLSIKLGVRDEKSEASSYKNMWPGVSVVRVNDEIRKEADIAKGLNGVVIGLVADPETPAGVAGLRPGDVVLSINGRAVGTVMDFYRALNDRAQKDVTFKVNRKGTEVSVSVGR
jgi:Do/DeqQ family serine protease